jgi:hypothetical protein
MAKHTQTTKAQPTTTVRKPRGARRQSRAAKTKPRRPLRRTCQRVMTIGRHGTTRRLRAVFQGLHAKRLEALANYTTGTMRAPQAAIHAIGTAYAAVAEIAPKSAIKQVDRFLSNQAIDVEALTPHWAAFILGQRKEVLLALDWTEFDDDDHATLAAYVITTHGRATPLCWKTVQKSTLKRKRTAYELEMVDRLHAVIPTAVDIELLADRGFGSQVLYDRLKLLGWHYTIRFRGTIIVEYQGEVRPAKEWLPASGRATMLPGALVTRDRTEVGAVVAVHAKRMKEPWLLVTSRVDRSATETVKVYGRRFSIEETFRDQKDLRFGMGLRATHIQRADRRDRMLLLLAVAQALLTLLGAASERSGMDAYLKANTVKRRTHSLYRQGWEWYHMLPTMRKDWFNRLMSAFAEVLAEQAQLTKLLGAI